MKVFVTGATGFVGSAIVQELLGAGHQVLGLARSDAGAQALAAAGAQVHRGSLEDLTSLRRGAAAADGVIHTAFVHDFSAFAAAADTDRRAIEALGAELAGSARPLVVTSGVAGLPPGRVVTEADAPTHAPGYPRRSEEVALALAAQGLNATVVRLAPSVHGAGDHGFVPMLIGIAREKGVAAYVGDGGNRWPAVHRLDAARLYRLVLERGTAGTRYHGIAEEGVPMRDIAAVIGRRLGLPVVAKAPEEAAGHFGWMAGFVGLDAPASSAFTQQQLGWHASQASLLEDMEHGDYFAS
ncbi:SDR family oxidoreductase [Hymenobacter ruricola]|uniref:SDR family oxidoreductase n=1 Tax=Hymenobacter ruricola TaxID=2791023 RepID=A0ABS0I053_9BACT|nr:SDR family oxidoreductase [Hymenobacter ruricola]MBF9220308.1 SDR family oxidoreductase [Hymenobacter ruricola]